MKQAAVMANMLLIGDSFVSHLDEYVARRHGYIAVNGSIVEMHGYSGANVSRLERQSWRLNFRASPLVFVHIGSNDLCRRDNTPWQVADQIIRFARRLVSDRGVARVVVCEVLRRHSESEWIEGSLEHYNAKVDSTNQLLRLHCGYHEVRYWGFGPTFYHWALFANDGIHLNAKGNRRYMEALIMATKVVSDE